MPHEWIFSNPWIRVFTEIDASNVLKADAISPKFQARRSKENYSHHQVNRTPYESNDFVDPSYQPTIDLERVRLIFWSIQPRPQVHLSRQMSKY